MATARRKSAQETGTNESIVSVKEDVKENKEEQPVPYIAECVEQTVARPEHTY